jgi:hypothetical protein
MKQTKKQILLGYEEGTGTPVELPLSHLIVTGVTQLSGKTTTLEALIARSGLRAIVFKTKIGERVFHGGTLIPPFYKERSDWQYVEALLEATLREKLKFERSWIIRACQGASSLFDVSRNIDQFLANEKLRAMDRDIFTNLKAYFEIVLPQLQYANFSRSLEIRDGINIMDLERFKEEIQSLVIRAVLDAVLTETKDVVVVIPEAWKFLPQSRGNPVKSMAESFIRQGGTNDNWLWVDSQDMSGVDKKPLKQVSEWILGLQTERNEVTHTLDQISVAKAHKPKPEEIMTLSLGHFVVVTPKMTKRVYVRPIWMTEKDAIAVASGKRKSEEFQQPDTLGLALSPEPRRSAPEPAAPPTASGATPGQFNRLNRDVIELREATFTKFQEFDGRFDTLVRGLVQDRASRTAAPSADINIDDIVSRVLMKIPAGGGTLKVEPREVVLRQFQQAEVERILEQTESLSSWQKQVIAYTEAKGSEVSKAELLKRLLGKSADDLARTYKQKYSEVDEVVTFGFLRKDSKSRIYPNLAKHIEKSLEAYSPSKTDVNDVIGQVLLRLKEQ